MEQAPRPLTPQLAAAEPTETGPTGWKSQLTALLESPPLAGSNLAQILEGLGMLHPQTISYLTEADLLSKDVAPGHARYLLGQLFGTEAAPTAQATLMAPPLRPPAEFSAVVPACAVIAEPAEWVGLSLDLVAYIATWEQSAGLVTLVRQQFDSPWTDLHEEYPHGDAADVILARALIAAMRAPAASENMRELVERDLVQLHGMRALQTLSRQILLCDDDLDTVRKDLVRRPTACRGDEFLAADLQKFERAVRDCKLV